MTQPTPAEIWEFTPATEAARIGGAVYRKNKLPFLDSFRHGLLCNLGRGLRPEK